MYLIPNVQEYMGKITIDTLSDNSPFEYLMQTSIFAMYAYFLCIQWF